MPARRCFAITLLVLMWLLAACIPPPEHYVAGTAAPGGQERSGRPVSAASFAGAKTGMLAVNAGSAGSGGPSVLMVTTDGGVTWNRGFGSDSPIVAIDFASPQLGWFATELMLLVTQDGGASWKPVPVAHIEPIEQVDFVDASHSWVRRQPAAGGRRSPQHAKRAAGQSQLPLGPLGMSANRLRTSDSATPGLRDSSAW